MSTLFQKYAAALIPLAILVLAGIPAVQADPDNLSVWLPFVVLVLGAVGTWAVPLFPTGWQGRAKIGVSAIAAAVSAVLPFLLPTGWNPETSIPLLLIAILNATATALGVTIRTEPLVATGAGTKADPAVITSLVADPASVPVGDRCRRGCRLGRRDPHRNARLTARPGGAGSDQLGPAPHLRERATP